MACGGLSNLGPFVVDVYVLREDTEVFSSFARNSVRHGVDEWGLGADDDTELTLQDI